MQDYYEDYTIPQTKFENQSVSFNHFANVTEEDYERIKELVKTFLTNKGNGRNGLDLYTNAITYITAPKSFLILKNFDEKALFLILAVDKNLTAYKTYLKIPTYEVMSSEFISDEEQKRIFFESNKVQRYQDAIRSELGFYNRILLVIEQAYFRKFLSDKVHLANVNKNYTKNFFKTISLIRNFNGISNEDYERIKASVETWTEQVGPNPNANTIIFSLCEQTQKLNIKNVKEQYLFLIMALDPEFKLLKIYIDESRMDIIERRCIEEFGFFNLELIKLEMDYHRRFRSDEFISEWYDEKKKL